MQHPLKYKEFCEKLSPVINFKGTGAKANKIALGAILKKEFDDESAENELIKSAVKEANCRIDPTDKARTLKNGTGHREIAWAVYYYFHRYYPDAHGLDALDHQFLKRTVADFLGQHVDGRPYVAEPSGSNNIVESGAGVSKRPDRLPSGSLPLPKSAPTEGHWVSRWHFRALAASLAAITFTSLFFCMNQYDHLFHRKACFRLKFGL